MVEVEVAVARVVERLLPAGAPRASRYLLYGLLALSGAGLLLLIWGLIEPYLVEWRLVRAPIDHLPARWRGRRVIAFGDVQVGSFLSNKGATRRIVARVIEERPDLVLLLGDLVYKGAGRAPCHVKEVVGLVAPLAQAGLSVYAVLGNHDYEVTKRAPNGDGERVAHLVDALEAAGVHVLENESVPLALDGGTDGGEGAIRQDNGQADLYLVGIGCHEAENDDPIGALSRVPAGAARLVVMHHPDSFAGLPTRTAPVAVSGHMHGGQVRLPGVPNGFYKRLAKVDEVHLDGWADGYGEPGNRLYVNRGVGFGWLPLRINARPEVTVFVLEPAPKK